MPLLFIAVASFLFCFHRIKLHIDKPVGYGKIYLSEKVMRLRTIHGKLPTCGLAVFLHGGLFHDYRQAF